MNKDVDILNKAIETERFAIAVYEIALGTGLLGKDAAQLAKIFQHHHGEHAAKVYETIKNLGGEPVKLMPLEEHAKKLPQTLVDEKSIIRYALNLEKEATIIYLNTISEFENRKVAQAAASILGEEAMHWTALRSALGLTPVHISFIPLSADEVED